MKLNGPEIPLPNLWFLFIMPPNRLFHAILCVSTRGEWFAHPSWNLLYFCFILLYVTTCSYVLLHVYVTLGYRVHTNVCWNHFSNAPMCTEVNSIATYVNPSSYVNSSSYVKPYPQSVSMYADMNSRSRASSKKRWCRPPRIIFWVVFGPNCALRSSRKVTGSYKYIHQYKSRSKCTMKKHTKPQCKFTLLIPHNQQWRLSPTADNSGCLRASFSCFLFARSAFLMLSFFRSSPILAFSAIAATSFHFKAFAWMLHCRRISSIILLCASLMISWDSFNVASSDSDLDRSKISIPCEAARCVSLRCIVRPVTSNGINASQYRMQSSYLIVAELVSTTWSQMISEQSSMLRMLSYTQQWFHYAKVGSRLLKWDHNAKVGSWLLKWDQEARSLQWDHGC